MARRVKFFDDELIAKKVFEQKQRASKSTYNYKTNNKNNFNKNSNEVVVKITGNSKHFESFKKHIDYITRKNELEIHLEDNISYIGKEDTNLFKNKFNRYGDEIPRADEVQGQEKREVYHIIFSMKEHSKVPEEKLRKAVMKTVKEMYPNNASAFVFHGDTDNPHIHTVLKVVDTQGKRLDIRKIDLANLRINFAKELNNLGIEAQATIKRDYKKEDRKNHHYKVVEFGKAKYKFSQDENAKDSYYVRYETKKGNVDIWSNDLERVVNENNVKVGEFVRFKIVGKEPVEIETYKKIKGKKVRIVKQAHKSIWDCSVHGREKTLKEIKRLSIRRTKYILEVIKSKIAEFKKTKNKSRNKTNDRDKTNEMER